MAGLTAWRTRYERLGLATLPLRPGSKRPTCDAWQVTPPPVQWHEAGTGAGNIGLRCGNGFAVADADSPQTHHALAAHWAGLGVKPPAVVTPSGGRHFYLPVADMPDGMAYVLWHSDVGPGELRVGPGAQVAAPCSAVGGRRYHFTPGTAPEDLLRLRPLRWRDLAPLLRPKSAEPLAALPVPLPRRPLADWALWLLKALAVLPPGQAVRVARAGVVLQYASRSEAEQAVVLHAAWCGWDFTEVAALFERHQPGHYASRRDKERYLRTCWGKALGWLAGTPERETVARLYRWAEARPWPGRGGGSDFLAYRVLLQRAWLADTLTPDVGRRDVQLSAALGWEGARGALQRLVHNGLVVPGGQRQRPTDARTWRLVPDVADGDGQPPARAIDALPGEAELWAVLGRAAGMVYARLNAEPQRVGALALATGKHRNTVANALRTLARYGLATDTADGWVVGAREAAEVADELGAAVAKSRRERGIASERETFREVLALRHE